MKKIITLLACITCTMTFAGKHKKSNHSIEPIIPTHSDSMRMKLREKLQKKDDETKKLKAVIAQISQAHHQVSVENNTLKQQLDHAHDLIRVLGNIVLTQNPQLIE